MSFRFHPDTEAELFEAIQYYEDVEPGLGQELQLKSIRRYIARLLIRVPGWFLKGKSGAR
jgi:hypothetical protein